MTELPTVLVHWHGERDDAGVEQAREDVARPWAWEPRGAAEIIQVRVAGLVEVQSLVQREAPGDGETPD